MNSVQVPEEETAAPQSLESEKKLHFPAEILSDEILLDIFLRFLLDPETLAQLSKVNKRFRNMLQEERVITRVLESIVGAPHRDLFVASTSISPLEQLGFYQAVVAKGLMKENRVGFDFASTDIDQDGGEASLIKGSRSRMDAVGGILQRFQNARLIVEAHCGTAAPPGIASDFSRARGQAVCSGVAETDYNTTEDRITLNPWGRRVAQRASSSDHKNGIVARKGRGWVELYLVLGDMELPRRPSYYEGLQLQVVDDEPHRILW